MCAISGFFSNYLSDEDREGRAQCFLKALNHRGPNDQGIWSNKTGLTFVHNRLSIIDLSTHAAQPMKSKSKRYTLVYNGEIYNYRALKVEVLKSGHTFSGDSDTEVLLALIEAHGLKVALTKITGMFAFALWDSELNSLFLSRDAMGEKPLYYGWVDGEFLFASELKAFFTIKNFSPLIDRESLRLFLRHNYVPGPRSIFKNIFKLQAGTYLEVDLSSPNTEMVPMPYWSLSDSLHPIESDLSDSQIVDGFEDKLTEVIESQMVSDVPLGAFLSGGIDSSLIVAIMKKVSPDKVKTFTIGFEQKQYDESNYARAVAEHLGTDHTELIVSPSQILGIVDRLPEIYDEPFSDSSQIPTVLLSQMTSEHVTVSLSGDGGDELFGGYNRYLWVDKLWGQLRSVPGIGRGLGATIIKLFSENTWDTLYQTFKWTLPKAYQVHDFGQKLYKIEKFLKLNKPLEMYETLISHWYNESVVLGVDDVLNKTLFDSQRHSFVSFTQEMMYLDSMTYLPDDIMVKVDRASMYSSLESRAPLLDRRLIEHVWPLEEKYKIRDNESKWLLRQVLNKYVPQKLIDRPKKGFGVPIEDWLRGDLRDWAEDLLSESSLSDSGLFNVNLIRSKWLDHSSQKANYQYKLWDVLIFESWRRKYGFKGE